MPPQTPTAQPQVQPLDTQVVSLAKAIRQTESGGNFNAKGASGEFGAYQWTPDTWKAHATTTLGDPNAPMTPSNQNAVAYTIIKQWRDQGLNPAQIAAKWNSGSATGWENKVGVNSMGVQYNVPQYVKKVTDAYQQFKGGGQNIPQTPAVSQPAPQEASPSVGGFLNNVVSSAGNLVAGLGNVLMHPIDTAKNLLSTGAGAVEKVFGVNNEDTQKFDNVVHYFAQRYGGGSVSEVVKNIGHTLYTDPVGAALDLSTFLDGVGGAVGALGKVNDIAKAGELARASDFISTASGILKSGSPEAINALRTDGTLTKIADAVKTVSDHINPVSAVGKVASKAVGVAGRLAGESLGVSTGAGYGAIKGAFRAGQEGGAAQQAFRAGISGGETAGDALVQTAQDAFRSIKNEQQSTYQTQLETIKNGEHTLTPEAIKPVFDKYDELLKKFDVVKNPDGTLDFENSRLSSESGSVSDLKQINSELNKYQSGVKQISPANMDHLKQFIADRYTAGTRGSAFTTPLADAVRTVLKKNVKGYEQLTAGYAQTAQELKDLKALSLGGKAGKETIIKKLTNTMRGNNEYRLKLLQELENKSGSNIVSQASGVALNNIVPKGLIKYTEILLHSLNPSFILALPFESPRVVGEFVHALGKGDRVLEGVGKAFINYKGPTVLKAGVIDNQATQQ